MSEAAFACPKCKTVFSVAPETTDLSATCPTCSSQLEAHFFPAFLRPIEAETTAAALVDSTETSCFYHPQKQAVRICDGCGRLICSMCSIDMGAQHLCPSCVSSGSRKGRITTLENSRTRYDSIALSLAAFGLFTSFFSFILAPAAIYTVIRHWNSPASPLGRARGRMVVALVVAILSLLIWGGFMGAAIWGRSAIHPHHHA